MTLSLSLRGFSISSLSSPPPPPRPPLPPPPSSLNWDPARGGGEGGPGVKVILSSVLSCLYNPQRVRFRRKTTTTGTYYYGDVEYQDVASRGARRYFRGDWLVFPVNRPSFRFLLPKRDCFVVHAQVLPNLGIKTVGRAKQGDHTDYNISEHVLEHFLIQRARGHAIHPPRHRDIEVLNSDCQESAHVSLHFVFILLDSMWPRRAISHEHMGWICEICIA